MGASNDVPGEVIQKLLTDKSKQIDELELQISVYERVMLEEMQNPTIMPNITNNFANRYSTYSTLMKTEFNTKMNNENYISFDKTQIRIINIIFDFENCKINVVTPTNFKLKVIFETAVNKLSNQDDYKDIKQMHFTYNSEDVSNNFYDNNTLDSIKIADQGVISVIKTNNVTISNTSK